MLRGPPEAFGNALMVTRNHVYTEVLRGQIDNLYAAAKRENGKILLPSITATTVVRISRRRVGVPGGLSNLREVETDIYMWALEARDLERLPKRGWIGYLTSGDPGYPLDAFQRGIQEIEARRRACALIRARTISRITRRGGRGKIPCRPQR